MQDSNEKPKDPRGGAGRGQGRKPKTEPTVLMQLSISQGNADWLEKWRSEKLISAIVDQAISEFRQNKQTPE